MKQSKRIVKRRRTMLYALLGAAFLLQNPAISHAEEEPVYSLEQVVVTANRVPTKASEAAANVDVISREQIEKGHYRSIGEILSEINGVAVTDRGYPGASQTVRLNGDSRVLVLIDGRKIGRPEGTSDRASVDLSTITALDNIERIEVVKGGASALYGSDAVGGVINIITRKGGSKQAASMDTSIGSWGLRTYDLNLQGTQDKFSWYITAGKKHQDHTEYNVLNTSLTPGSSKGDTYRWPNSEFDSQTFTVRLDNKIDENQSLTFNVEHFNQKSGQPGLVRLSYYPYTFYNDIGTQLSNQVALTYNFNQKSSLPGFTRLYSNYTNYGLQGTYKSRTDGFQYQTGWQVDDKNSLIAGSDWEKESVLENLADDGSVNYKDKSITNTAVYLQDIYKIDRKWTLTPGVRYDYHSRFGGQTSPKLNVNYGADKTTDLYVSYNRVFKAPTLDDLYYNKPAWNMYGNPDLKPEDGYVVNAGMNKKISDSTNFKVNLFSSRISDAIDWVADDPNDPYSPYRVANIKEEKKHGIEFEVKHKFSAKYFTEFGYSILHIEKNDGNGSGYKADETNSQPRSYQLKLGYRDALWDFDLKGQGVDGRDAGAFIDKGYWIWNMAVNYKLNKDASLYFIGNNLTNKAYEINTSESTGLLGNYPMAARNFQMGVHYQF